METSIPYFEVEAVMAAIRLMDETENDRALNTVFQRTAIPESKIVLRYRQRRAGRVRHTTMGGEAAPSREGQIKEVRYSPSRMKVFQTLSAEDLRLFASAAVEIRNLANGVAATPSGTAAIAGAQARILEISSDFGADFLEERHVLCSQVVATGVVNYKVFDADHTADYQLNSLTRPTTKWSDTAATIRRDLDKLRQEFRDNNFDGKGPTHIVASKKLFRDYIVNNAEMAEWMKLNEQLVAGWFRVGGTELIDPMGMPVDPLFGMRWLMTDGQYTDYDGSLVDRFPVERLGFLNLEADGAQPAWSMVLDPLMNPQARVNVEVKEPKKGEAVKAYQITAFENGLPTFVKPDLCQNVEVIWS